jgi:hypothetical protein
MQSSTEAFGASTDVPILSVSSTKPICQRLERNTACAVDPVSLTVASMTNILSFPPRHVRLEQDPCSTRFEGIYKGLHLQSTSSDRLADLLPVYWSIWSVQYRVVTICVSSWLKPSAKMPWTHRMICRVMKRLTKLTCFPWRITPLCLFSWVSHIYQPGCQSQLEAMDFLMNGLVVEKRFAGSQDSRGTLMEKLSVYKGACLTIPRKKARVVSARIHPLLPSGTLPQTKDSQT